MYRVYENNKRCSEYNIAGWDVDEFESFREAVAFMYAWAYSLNVEGCLKSADQLISQQTEEQILSSKYEMGQFVENEVVMSIREIN
jgi:hypothetical protein